MADQPPQNPPVPDPNDLTTYTGLLEESPAQKQSWKESLVSLPPFAASDLLPETRWDHFPTEAVDWLRQGPTNSCGGHGEAHSLAMAYYCQTGQKMTFSPWFAYLQGQRFGGNYGRDSGAYLGSLLRAAQEVGNCPLSYLRNPGRYDATIPPAAVAAAAEYKLVHSIDLERDRYEGLRTLCGQNIGAGVFAVYWGIQADRTGKLGVPYYSRYIPTGRGGHCMALICLSTETGQDGRPDVWAINSHPDHGPYLVSARFVDEVMARDEWGAWGVSTLSVVKPQVDWRLRSMMN